MVHPPSGKYNYRGVCKLCRTAQGGAKTLPFSALFAEGFCELARVLRLRFLLLLRGRSGGLWRRRGLSLNWLRLQTLEYRGRTASPGSIDGECDGSDHECHGGPRRSLGKRAGRTARTEGRLAALPAKSCGNIAALAALQQNNHDDEKTNQDVDSSDQINHRFGIFLCF
jgi:hypothetical protein